MTLVGPKLFGGSNYGHFATISNKYCTFAWSYEDKAVGTVIYVNISGDIKYEQETVLAVLYIKLLLFY
jgi:hypothetical protein